MSPVVGYKPIAPGATLGVFTPSSPAYVTNPGLFENGLRNLEKLGFKIKLGSLTAQRSDQGYRSGTGQARAAEFMDLVRDPSVDALISTIGGMNSASMIPHLDFAEIRRQRKMMCGYSDVTSLHMSILEFAGLTTLYGPGVMCWFGDWPDGVPESTNWFLSAARLETPREIQAPKLWSNHARRWDNGDWRTIPREWKTNDGWRVLNSGSVTAPILALNLNTMMSAAGTDYWPDFDGKILLLEDMEAPMSRTERSLTQLRHLGVFDRISGLIVGKPEVFRSEGAPFSYDDLFLEVVGPRAYPIVSNFDCSHCVPMISVPQLATVELRAEAAGVTFRFV